MTEVQKDKGQTLSLLETIAFFQVRNLETIFTDYFVG
jgi:hypothetical protein